MTCGQARSAVPSAASRLRGLRRDRACLLTKISPLSPPLPTAKTARMPATPPAGPTGPQPSSPDAPERELQQLRVQIDALDHQLVDLLNARAKVVVEIGKVKQRRNE